MTIYSGGGGSDRKAVFKDIPEHSDDIYRREVKIEEGAHHSRCDKGGRHCPVEDKADDVTGDAITAVARRTLRTTSTTVRWRSPTRTPSTC